MAKIKLTIKEVLQAQLTVIMGCAEKAEISQDELFEGIVEVAEADEDEEAEGEDDEAEDEESTEDFINALTDLDEVKAIAKALGITAGKKAIGAIKKEILKADEEALNEALVELGYMEADDEEGEEDEAEDYSEMTLADLKVLAKEREITVTKKDTEATLIEKLEAYDEENAEDDEEGEEDEAEGEDYSELTLAQLKALAKEREITVTKKDTEESLIEKLEAYDEENAEDDEEGEEDEDEDEEVTEEDVLEILNACSMEELTKLVKKMKIKVEAKDKEKAIIKKVMAKEIDDIVTALEATGIVEA